MCVVVSTVIQTTRAAQVSAAIPLRIRAVVIVIVIATAFCELALPEQSRCGRRIGQ